MRAPPAQTAADTARVRARGAAPDTPALALAAWAALAALALLCGCSGFEAVREDAGADGSSSRDGKTIDIDANTKGFFGFGACCKGNTECVSGLCASIASGRLFCTEYCKRSPDSCPPGFECGAKSGICVPPGGRKSICSGDIKLARAPRKLGQCCARDAECESGRCYDDGAAAWPFCSRPCAAASPCPVPLTCDARGMCERAGGGCDW